MGGKSSSSASSQTVTTTSDERVAATDDATVVRVSGNNNTLSDYGAIEAAGELSLEVINNLSQVALQGLSQNSTVIDELGKSVDTAYEFASAQTGQDGNQTLVKLLPWLMGGVSIIALTGGFKK